MQAHPSTNPGIGTHLLLMIDDDVDLGDLLSEYLARFGHRLITVGSATDGWNALARESPDLVILDIMLPDKDGLTLCREIRSQYDVPIVMLTARGEVADRIVGLEFGADDYVPKPFEPRELVARIESVLRRSKGRSAQTSEVLSCDGLRVNLATRRVLLDDEDIELTTMEFELLCLLMEGRGRVLSRDRLLENLQGLDVDVYDRSIDMLISRLRQKLADNSRSPRFIKTVWRTGYQFVGKGAA